MRFGSGSGKTFKIFVPGEQREIPKSYRNIFSSKGWKDAEADEFRLGWSANPVKYEEEGTSATHFWSAFERYVLENINKITDYEKGDREKIIQAIFEARSE